MEKNGRVVFRVIFLIGFCWFLLFAVSATFKSTRSSKGASNHAGLFYVSKRRVPNGPDPIHNRRTRNTGQPPNRA